MSQQLSLASDLYRLSRTRKPTAKVIMCSALAMVALCIWASVTKINVIVTQPVKIVGQSISDSQSISAANANSTISGEVVEVVVSESQAVSAGQVLVRLNPAEHILRRSLELEKSESYRQELKSKQIELQLANARHEKEKTELKVQLANESHLLSRATEERELNIKHNSAALNQFVKELRRMEKLKQSRAVSQSEVESLRSEVRKAKADLDLAKLPLKESAIAEIESRIETLNSTHTERVHRIEAEATAIMHKLSSTKSEIDLLAMKIKQCEIKSICAGVVSTCLVQVGDWVKPGQLELRVSQREFKAEAFLPSESIGNVKAADRAVIFLDGISWLMYGSLSASVETISPEVVQQEVVMGDGSTIVVDGYRVWLNLESNEEFDRWASVRLGMTGSVEIQTGKKSLAVYLIEQAIGDGWLPSRSLFSNQNR